MSSLTQVSLAAREWTEISGDMVTSTRYEMTGFGGAENVRFAESASSPTSTTSFKKAAIGEPVEYLYDGTAIYAYATEPGVVLNIVTAAQ